MKCTGHSFRWILAHKESSVGHEISTSLYLSVQLNQNEGRLHSNSKINIHLCHDLLQPRVRNHIYTVPHQYQVSGTISSISTLSMEIMHTYWAGTMNCITTELIFLIAFHVNWIGYVLCNQIYITYGSD